MAIFRPSTIVGAISGSVGGQTFVQGRGSAVVRHRPSRTIAPGGPLQESQSEMNQIQDAWASLSSPDRLSWRTAALSRPSVSRLGLQRPLSGHQLFTKENLLAHGESQPQFTTPRISGSSEPPPAYTIVGSDPTSIALTADIPNGAENARYWLFARLLFTPTPPGWTPPLVFMAAKNDFDLEIDIIDEVSARFGVPQVGQPLFVGCRCRSAGFYVSPMSIVFKTIIPVS